jgi:hypothetical protein
MRDHHVVKQRVVAIWNNPRLDKFAVMLACGHRLVCDWSVSSVREFRGKTATCFLCSDEKQR